jgi:altronate dehydratase small subunit
MFHALQLETVDNVATVVTEVDKGTVLTVQTPSETLTITSVDSIPFGHKIALASIEQGGTVTKYGRPIGRATSSIPKGGMVGAHNVEGRRGRGDLVAGRGASK